MDNNNNFEALIEAIKESSKPTVELAKVLQDRFKPVVQSKLRDPDISKLNFGNTSYEVSYDGRCFNGEDVAVAGLITGTDIIESLTPIKNEISTDQGCVSFIKGMLYEINDTDYVLTKAIESGDQIFVTFTASADKVLI